MFDKLEGTVLDIKTPGLNNPETHIITQNRFNTYMVLIFSDLNKAQIYKMPYRDSPHDEKEIVMSFNYLYLFKPNGHKEDYHIRKTNDEKFLIEIEDKKYVYVEDKIFSFETIDLIVIFSSDLGFNDIKFPYVYGEESVYFMLHRKYIPTEEHKTSTEKRRVSVFMQIKRKWKRK